MQKEYPEMKFKSAYTSHNGRDTFITLAVIAGANWKSILTWVGQTSYKIMNRYIKLMPAYQQEEMIKIF